MTQTSCFSRFPNRRLSPARMQRMVESLGVAILSTLTAVAVAQNPIPTPGTQMSVPDGYTVHEAIDMGGRMVNTTGSGAMYGTLVDLESGPRVQGENFELRALPGKKGGLVDYLKAFSSGFGGDPENVAKLDFNKGKWYDFSGMFRRDRQHFDYDLLGNPNIPSGQSIAINGSTARYAWPQVQQSPFLFNTVRRMTDTNLTILPLSKVTFRAGYSQNIFQGPSLTPGGYFGVISNDILTQEYQRNSTDDFTGSVEWKPVPQTSLTYEQQVMHYKGDSYFTLDPTYLNVQEADGKRVALLANYDSLTPYAASSCNAGYTSILRAPQTSGGLPIIDPACAVISSYTRTQPTRALYPTEIFRLQSSSIKNVTLNGNVRYTSANMNMPNYYEGFQGLSKAVRSSVYTGSATAKRQTIAVDYGMIWQVAKNFSLAEQVNYSNVHQPGSAVLTSETTQSVPTGTAATITYTGPLTQATSTAAPEGMPGVNNALFGFFGQKFVTNNLTGSWNVSPRTTLSLTWRYSAQTAHYNSAKYANDDEYEEEPVDITIHENGGILNAAFRPASNWTINGTLELLYHDNALTPVAPRQTQHYKVRTAFRPKPWATISGSYNDMERHNNTNNTGAASMYGPLDHADHSRYAGVGAVLAPNEHYGLEFNYAYSDVYTSTNTCYTGIQTAGFAAAAPANGASCYDPAANGGTVAGGGTGVDGNTPLRGGGAYEFGPVKDFMDAPTQFGTVALTFSPVDRFHSSVGYTISSVNGSRWFNDARDVNGSLVSTYQSPFVNVAYTVHKGFIWNGAYNYYGYGEGGRSGAQYCSATNPTLSSGAPNAPLNPITVVACSSLPNTAMNGATPVSGFTAPRNFHANNVTLGFHYEF